jgi:hypothetical protein
MLLEDSQELSHNFKLSRAANSDMEKKVAELIVALVDAKSAPGAKHTASRTKLASHAQRAKDVPVNFS